MDREILNMDMGGHFGIGRHLKMPTCSCNRNSLVQEDFCFLLSPTFQSRKAEAVSGEERKEKPSCVSRYLYSC